MSNQEKESGKPKLREIKKTTASRQFLSGAGTGPNDCMSPEIYSALCDMGALKSDVYVCGQGWLGPDDYKGGGSSSGGCGTSGTSGSWSGSSGGSSGDYIDWIVSGGNYEWENWAGWSGWNNFSGWTNSSGSLDPSRLSNAEKEAILQRVRKEVGKYYGSTYDIVLNDGPTPVGSGGTASVKDGTVYIGNSFFYYDFNDQVDILWHEFYHLQRGHDNIPQGRINFGEKYIRIVLQPDGDLKTCMENLLKVGLGDSLNDSTFQADLCNEIHVYSLSHPLRYEYEIEAYKAELKNGLPKSDYRKCQIRWTLWKYEHFYRIAKSNMSMYEHE